MNQDPRNGQVVIEAVSVSDQEKCLSGLAKPKWTRNVNHLQWFGCHYESGMWIDRPSSMVWMQLMISPKTKTSIQCNLSLRRRRPTFGSGVNFDALESVIMLSDSSISVNNTVN
jgi:hypothetical protein